jgi:ABC-type glycerol-3-phosphate transport system substrate-binding protein
MGRAVIDQTFAGLLSPLRSFSVGRPDLPDSGRPGPALLAAVAAMTRDGVFDFQADSDPGRGYAPLPSGPSVGMRASRAFDFEDDAAFDR